MNNFANLSWDLRQRLMFLEARLIWAGEVSAQQLRDTFAMTDAQVQKDLALYQERAPGNLRRDVDGERYRASDRFEPQLLHGTAQEFLQVLQTHSAKAKVPDSPLALVALGMVPTEILRRPEREFDVRILQRVTAAIREQRWLTVRYQSLSHPQPRSLRLAPHALAHTDRWHVRAWSESHAAYRDFLLARIHGVPELEEARGHDAHDDWDWRNFVTLKIGAHPDLTPAQRNVVESDYGMQHGIFERVVRVALVPYDLQQLGLSRENTNRAPAEQPLVLLNRSEIEGYNRFK